MPRLKLEMVETEDSEDGDKQNEEIDEMLEAVLQKEMEENPNILEEFDDIEELKKYLLMK
jgi:hypothetical protein